MATREASVQSSTPQAGPTPAASPTMLLAFVTIVVVLGMNFVAVRFSNQELPPFWGASLRFAVAALLLLGLVGALRVALPRGWALVGGVLYGVLAFAAMYGLAYWGMLQVSAGMASVLFATIPLLTLLFAIVIGLERFRWRGLAGAAVVLAGIGLAFQEQVRADVAPLFLLAVFAAAVCGALSGIVVKRFPQTHPLSLNAVAMAIGASLLFIVSLIAAEARALPSLTPTWIALGWLVGSSIVGFVLMVWLIARWTASAVSYSTVLMPLVTVSAAAALAGEGVTPIFLAGSGLVLLGVYLGALAAPTTSVPAAQRSDQPATAQAHAGARQGGRA